MLCAGPRCRNRLSGARAPASGVRLCGFCQDNLAGQLALLPELYDRCEGMLVPRRTRAVERVRGGLPGGISLDDAAVAARARILAVLASWAGLVVDQRRLSRLPQRDVTDLAGFLTRHLAWLAAHPAADEIVTEIAALVRTAEDAVRPHGAVRIELGPCGQPGCGQIVTLAVNADNEPVPSQIQCEAGHVWLPHQWLLLKHRIEQARRAPNGGDAA
jgi:hypothetical protein